MDIVLPYWLSQRLKSGKLTSSQGSPSVGERGRLRCTDDALLCFKGLQAFLSDSVWLKSILHVLPGCSLLVCRVCWWKEERFSSHNWVERGRHGVRMKEIKSERAEDTPAGGEQIAVVWLLPCTASHVWNWSRRTCTAHFLPAYLLNKKPSA